MRRARRLWLRKKQTLILLGFFLYCIIVIFILNKLFYKEENTKQTTKVKPTIIEPLEYNNKPIFSKEEIKSGTQSKVAYVVVITNEDFVDGALVVGFSLIKESKLVLEGLADLILIVPENKISFESKERLKCAGWSYVMEVFDLSLYAPHAILKDTFNKLYIFNLTQYSRVAMFDGDMLMIRNPDVVFDTKLPNEYYVGAIGSHHKVYFQTGMMLVIPSFNIFNTLLEKLKKDKHQRDSNGRDGRLIRTFFKERYVILKHTLSIHIRPGDPLISRAIGLHYRGSWKPWFNRENPPPIIISSKQQQQNYNNNNNNNNLNSNNFLTSNEVSGQELGQPYHLWWKLYEQLHLKCNLVKDSINSLTRDIKAPVEYNPKINMWLMRYTSQSYIQKMNWVDKLQRSVTHPDLVLVESNEGESCDEACYNYNYDKKNNNNNNKEKNEVLICVEKALSFTLVNSEEALRDVFQCEYISQEIPASYHPSLNIKTQTCHINSLYGKRERPTCKAKALWHRRLCTCISSLKYNENVSFIPIGLNNNNNKNNNNNDDDDASNCLVWLNLSLNRETSSFSFEEKAKISKKCANFLSQWERMETIPRENNARTIKVRFYYKNSNNNISAIVKLEQLSFPLEPYAEYAAYKTSLLLGIDLVPPTNLILVSGLKLREALLLFNNNNKTDDDLERKFLEKELSWIRTLNNEKDILLPVSVQLWIPQRVIPFTNITPPITEENFNHWIQLKSNNILNNIIMSDITVMKFFDYIIGNEDRSFTHNSFVIKIENNISRVVLLDHGKSFRIDTTNDQNNNFLLSKQEKKYIYMSELNIETKAKLMCKLPERVLRFALRLSNKNYKLLTSSLLLTSYEKDKNNIIMENSESLAGLLLRTKLPPKINWRISEKSILASQLRLEKALEHFEKCVEFFGIQHVIS